MYGSGDPETEEEPEAEKAGREEDEPAERGDQQAQWGTRESKAGRVVAPGEGDPEAEGEASEISEAA